MKAKNLITTLFFVIVISLFTTVCFATDNMDNAMQDMKESAQDVGNVVQNTATGIGNGVKNGAEIVGNTVSNMGGAVKNMTGMTDMNDNNYTATRTATTTNTNNNFLGIGTTAWTWLIMGIVGLSIIGLVWYYGKEHEYSRRNNDSDY